jgi:hypothetical protein
VAQIEEPIILGQREGERPDAVPFRTDLFDHVRREQEAGDESGSDAEPVPENV